MRRAILALALGGVLLTSACDSDATPGTTSAQTAPSTAAAAPASPPPDYTANTKIVCDRLHKVFSDDLQGFASQLGKMIAYKEAKQTAEATKAERAARGELKAVGAKIKKETAAAQNPELKVAGTASAAKVTGSAADRRFFDRIRTTKDLNTTIETQMGEWLTPVAGYCP